VCRGGSELRNRFCGKKCRLRCIRKNIAETVTKQNPADLAGLSGLAIANGSDSVEETRKALVMKLGENISVRRYERYVTTGGKLSSYLHGSKIGVLLNYNRR